VLYGILLKRKGDCGIPIVPHTGHCFVADSGGLFPMAFPFQWAPPSDLLFVVDNDRRIDLVVNNFTNKFYLDKKLRR
jgi:hypothetical protein